MRSLLTFWLAWSCVTAHAQVILVNAAAPPGGTGATWSSAINNLHDALAIAQSGDEIWVVQGVYRPSDNGVNSTFSVPAFVSLYGGFVGNEEVRTERDPDVYTTELTGDRAIYTVVTISGDNAVVDGFTISDAQSTVPGSPESSQGAGVYSDSYRFFLRNNTFRGLQSLQGGAAVHSDGDENLSITGCVFTDCTGDACVYTEGSLGVVDSTFVDNDAGGIIQEGKDFSVGADSLIAGCVFESNSSGEATVDICVASLFSDARFEDCVFASNSMSHTGGIRFRGSGSLSVYGAVFRGNSAPGSVGGGAVSIQSASALANVTIANALFVANALDGPGAALKIEGLGDFNLTNCTMTANTTAGSVGAGLAVAGVDLDIENSIIYGNISNSDIDDERQPVFVVGGASVTATHSIIEDLGTGPSPITADVTSSDVNPEFVNVKGPDSVAGTADDDPTPDAGSPAIDAGNTSALNASSISFDAFGNTRRLDDTGTPDTGSGTAPIVDIGALEFQGTTPVCLADTNGDGSVTPADYNAWIIAFNSNARACDQNGDGFCTPADYNGWIINFNNGC